MSHQVFVDKMLSELSTPMVFLKESSFVFASNGRRWHWYRCSRGALTASLFARSKQEHPTPNKNTYPGQEHLAQTKTPYSNDNHAQTRTSQPKPGHPAETRTPRSNEDIPPKQEHLARTRTPYSNDNHAQTRAPARTKRFGKFLLNLPG